MNDRKPFGYWTKERVLAQAKKTKHILLPEEGMILSILSKRMNMHQFIDV